jgi:hypothetical protein
MSVFEFFVYWFSLALTHWDWYLFIGVIISIAFTSWDLKRFKDDEYEFLLEFFDIAPSWVGTTILFIANAMLWPLELAWRIYRSIIAAFSKPMVIRL